MGNENSKLYEPEFSKPTLINLSPTIIDLIFHGYIRVYFNDIIVPTEIIYLCCKYLPQQITTLTLTIISNSQYAKCYRDWLDHETLAISFKNNCLILAGTATAVFHHVPQPPKTKPNKKNKTRKLFRKKKDDLLSCPTTIRLWYSGRIVTTSCTTSNNQKWAIFGGSEGELFLYDLTTITLNNDRSEPLCKLQTTKDITDYVSQYDGIHDLAFIELEDNYQSKYVLGTNGDILFVYALSDMMNEECHKIYELVDGDRWNGDISEEQFVVCPFYKTWNVENKITCCTHYIYKTQKHVLIVFGTERHALQVLTPCYLYIADFESGEFLAKIHEQHAGIKSVDISPNGKLLVSAGSDSMVRLYDISRINWENVINEFFLEMSENEYGNGVQLICVFDVIGVDPDRFGIFSDVKFVKDNCIVGVTKDGKIYYMKLMDNMWEMGEINTDDMCGRSVETTRPLQIDGNIGCVVYNNMIVVHELNL